MTRREDGEEEKKGHTQEHTHTLKNTHIHTHMHTHSTWFMTQWSFIVYILNILSSIVSIIDDEYINHSSLRLKPK